MRLRVRAYIYIYIYIYLCHVNPDCKTSGSFHIDHRCLLMSIKITQIHFRVIDADWIVTTPGAWLSRYSDGLQVGKLMMEYGVR
jgi:hypothetical protein